MKKIQELVNRSLNDWLVPDEDGAVISINEHMIKKYGEDCAVHFHSYRDGGKGDWYFKVLVVISDRNGEKIEIKRHHFYLR